MSEIAHNHPPRCCCGWAREADSYEPVTYCPLCTEHGELAQLAQPQPGECPLCHSEIGKQHTDYCRFTGTVEALPILNLDDFHTQTSNPISLGPLEGTDMTHTQTSTPTTHARTELAVCGREPTPIAEDTPTAQPATCGHPDYPDCPHRGQHP